MIRVNWLLSDFTLLIPLRLSTPMNCKRALLLLWMVCIPFIASFSQEVLTTKSIYAPEAFRYLLPVKQVDGEAIAVTCNYGNKWVSFLVNEDHSISNEILKVVDDAGMYDNYLGYINSDKSYTLFFSNNRKNKFISLQFDYSQGTSQENILSLKIAYERYIASHNFGNKFYILTVNEASSIVNSYEFTASGGSTYQKKMYDLSQVDFSGKFTNLHHNLVSTEPGSKGISVSKILAEYPNSIPTNQALRKIYFQDSIAYLSLERLKHTLVLTFNLKEGTTTNKVFAQPELICHSGHFSSANSVISSNYLYQVNACSKELVLSISNLQTGHIAKQLHMAKDNVQDFTYTLFKQEIGESAFSSAKERGVAINTFLRKIANTQVSISVNSFTDSTLEVDIGKYEIRQSGMIVPTPLLLVGIITMYTDSYPSVIAAKSILHKSNFTQIEIDENSKDLKKNRNMEGRIWQRSANQFFIKRNETYLAGNFDPKKSLFQWLRYTTEDFEKEK
jgi:hypothetical protein